MRWLLVAQDGWGLGHVSRQLGLARELRRLCPSDEYLIVTYSEAAQVIAREGFASVKLPTSQPFVPADQLNIDPSLRIWLSSAIINTVMATYKPHAVVLDTFPIGLNGEFAALLRMQCLRFLVAREVINPPPHWEYQSSLKNFNALLAPYTEGEIDLNIPNSPKLHWVGPILIRGRRDLLPRAEARRRLGLPQQGRICLVSFGGGGDPAYGRLEQWIFQLAEKYPQWHFAFPMPPIHKGEREHINLGNASRFSYYPMAECYSAFDAAISTTGSSSYELGYMGVPSILIPSVSPQQIEDHFEKARRILGEHGGFVVRASDTPALEAAFAAMDDPARLTAMKEDRARLQLPNGAETGAALLMSHMQKLRH